MAKKSKAHRPQVVVITGASAGVGRAVARAYAKEGAQIGLIARGLDGLKATAQEVESLGGKALMLSLDVADAEAMDAAAARVEREFGPIDVWINCAFAGLLAPFADSALADFRRVTEVTYHGQVHGTMAALKRMKARNRGAIVLVGSALAYRGIPLQAAYCGAKHAIQGFHDSLRAELFHDRSKIRVSMVQLPGVNTPQFDWIRTTLPRKARPASPPYQPEVAAEAILFAAHSGRKEVVVGLPSLMAIVADKLASPLLDRYLALTAFSGQQDKERWPAGRQDNLYDPVPGDHGAHGRFDKEARRKSPHLWLTMNRNLVGAVTAAAAASILLLVKHGRSRRRQRKGWLR